MYVPYLSSVDVVSGQWCSNRVGRENKIHRAPDWRGPQFLLYTFFAFIVQTALIWSLDYQENN